MKIYRADTAGEPALFSPVGNMLRHFIASVRFRKSTQSPPAIVA